MQFFVNIYKIPKTKKPTYHSYTQGYLQSILTIFNNVRSRLSNQKLPVLHKRFYSPVAMSGTGGGTQSLAFRLVWEETES